jgi:glycine hydroxymethyltransferase
LHAAGITVNRNGIPFDTRSPMTTSGIRIGTSALATRGFEDDDFKHVAQTISNVILGKESLDNAQEEVKRLVAKFPLY